MEENNLKAQTISGFLWRFMERCGAQGVTFVVSIVVARILDPAVYGVVALVNAFIALFSAFVDSGMANSLIQKNDSDDLDFSTVFYFNLAMSVVVYLAIFFTAPLFANAYKLPELTILIRVSAITVLIAGVKNVQQAYVSKHMLFKRFFFATLGGTVGAACIGIYMAYHGYGVWAIIAQHLFNATVDTLILWITVKWRPKRMFSFQRLKGLFAYGWKILATGLIDTAYTKLRQFVIGLKYSAADLAFYNKGDTFPNLIVTNINMAIASVLFPVMSKVQDDKAQVRNVLSTSIKTSIYIIAPVMLGLAGTATPLIRLILTEKWLPCVPFLRICCISYIFYPLHSANLSAIKAIGRSDLFLKLEIFKKVSGVLILVVAMQFGIMAMGYSLLVTSLFSQIINSWPNKKLFDYSYFKQMKDILPSLLLSAFMGGCVYCVTLLKLNDWLTLAIQIPLGVLIYWLGSVIFKLDSYSYALKTIRSYLKKPAKKTNQTQSD